MIMYEIIYRIINKTYFVFEVDTLSYTSSFHNSLHSLVPRLLCVGGGKRAWYTLFAHAPSSLGNCILLRYTKINGNFCLPAERPHCKIILPVRHLRAVFKSETISLRH